MQTDSTLASINRIMSSTTFGSKNVFDSQSQIPVSNVSSQLSSVSLNAFAGDKSRAISVQLASAADGSLTATVDGQAATLSGNRLSFSTSTLSGEATLAAGTGAGTYSFTASPGGMNFAIGTSGQSVSFAFGQMDTTALGLDTLATGGANSLSSNPENAMSLAGAATETIARAQGRLGAFQQSTLETNLNSLQVGAENLASAGSSISDTDYASATLQQTQALILQKASIATQSQANLSAANVLSLLS